MAVDIGPKIGIDGEKEFRQELNQINTTLKTLGTEMKKVSSEFQENENSQEALKKKNEVLNKSIDEQKKKLEMVQKALQESAEQYGETSTKTQQWQQVVNRTETSLNDLQAQLKQNEEALGEMDKGLRDVETGMKKVEKTSDKSAEDIKKDFKDAAENGITAMSTALAGLAAALVATAETTREYRTDQAKLTVAFKDAGFSAETAKEAFTDIYAILGEDDTSVEAANHLAELTDNEEELAEWTGNILPGVFAKFGDSLPLEGLTEAANETAKVGTLTGSLADALNWAGINEDDFNAKLEKCSDEQERQQLITKTLAAIYTDAGTAYKETNKDVIEANKAQAELTDTMAELGAVAEPVITKLKNALTKIIKEVVKVVEKFNELPESAQNTILAIGGIGIAAGPTVKGISSVKSGISKLIERMRLLFSPAKTAATAVGAVGTTAAGATAGVTGIAGALKGLFAIIAANPIMAVVTALGLLAGGIAAYIEYTKEADSEAGKFNEKLKKSKKYMEEYNDTMSELKESRTEAISETTEEFGYYESLKKELDQIVDKNGKIEKGYEARADFITTKLSEALGIEIEATDGVIKNYDKLSESLDEVIEKKRAEAYLSAYEEEYQEAIKSRTDLYESLLLAEEDLHNKETQLEKAREKGHSREIARLTEEVRQARKTYEERVDAYTQNNNIIETQEKGREEFLKGHYDEVERIVGEGEKAISEMTATETRMRIEEVKKTLEQEKRLYEETGDETFKIQSEEHQRELEELQQHLSDMTGIIDGNTTFINSIMEMSREGYDAFLNQPWSSAGNEIVNGIDSGMRKKVNSIVATAGFISGKILDAFYNKLDINSPSKVMRDKVGMSITEGIAVGEEKGLPYITKANKKITDQMKNISIPQIGRYKFAGISENLTGAPTMNNNDQQINLTVYSVLDGQIISKTVQKNISKAQTGRMRVKGALPI
jgi:hypothetical protein